MVISPYLLNKASAPDKHINNPYNSKIEQKNNQLTKDAIWMMSFSEKRAFSEVFKAPLLASGMKESADKRSGHVMFNSPQKGKGLTSKFH